MKEKRTRCTKRNETRKIESKGVKYTQKGRSKKLKGFVRSRHWHIMRGGSIIFLERGDSGFETLIKSEVSSLQICCFAYLSSASSKFCQLLVCVAAWAKNLVAWFTTEMKGAAGILLRTVFNSNVLLIRTAAVLDGQTGMSLKVYEINHFLSFWLCILQRRGFYGWKEISSTSFHDWDSNRSSKHKACRCILKCNSMLNIRMLLALKPISFRISQKFVHKLAFAFSGMLWKQRNFHLSL